MLRKKSIFMAIISSLLSTSSFGSTVAPYSLETHLSVTTFDNDSSTALDTSLSGTFFVSPVEKEEYVPLGEASFISKTTKLFGTLNQTTVEAKAGDIVTVAGDDQTSSSSNLMHLGFEHVFSATDVIVGASGFQSSTNDADYDSSGLQWVFGIYLNDATRVTYTHHESKTEFGSGSVDFTTNQFSLRDFYARENGTGLGWEFSYQDIDPTYSPPFLVASHEKLTLGVDKYFNAEQSIGFKFHLDSFEIDLVLDQAPPNKEQKRSYFFYYQHFFTTRAAYRLSFRFSEKVFDEVDSKGLGASLLVRF